MKIALAQINPTVGDLDGNVRKIVDCARRARRRGAELVVFPELCVTGYPPQDLLENALFLKAVERAVAEAARSAPPDVGLLLGAPVPNPGRTGKRLYNAALLYEGGTRRAAAYKTLLPSYDIFDEHRYFEPAAERRVISWRGWKLGVHICEDMWNSPPQASPPQAGLPQAAHRIYDEDPVADLAAQGADVLINLSASPFAVGKPAEREALTREICRAHGRPFPLCNTVGANTEVLFDGASRLHAADGTPLACAASFEEDLLLWDLQEGREAAPQAARAVPRDDDVHDDVRALHEALVLGIRDYFEKTGLFEKALVGLSGGIDSSVVAALAVRALGPERVVGVTMPSKYSSPGSVTDSEALAERLGIALHHVSIEPAVAAFERMLAEVFAGTAPGVAEENIQARARGVTLMALSNKFGHLVLSTGNKSETAVGYTTLYGDMSGGLAVLSDVFKTDVYRLADHINHINHINRAAGAPVIPPSVIDKPPSAELAPGQKDADSLPPYAVLDAVLRRYVEQQRELGVIVAETGLGAGLVQDILRRVDRNEYKRRQAPPGLRVSDKAFGLGRRLPIVMRWERKAKAEAAEAAEAPVSE